jgi:hypothetical protein
MGDRLVSLVIPPLTESPLSTHQHSRLREEDYNGDLVDFKGESGTTGISYDTNIVCCAFDRRAWVSVCSVSVFTTKTSGVQHQIQDAFLKKSSSRIPTQLGSASLFVLDLAA